MLCPHGLGQWSWPLISGLQPPVLVRKWWPHLLGLCLLIPGSGSSSPSDLCMHGLIFRVLFPSLLPMSVSFRPGWKCFCRCSSSMDIVGSQPHHETPEFSTGLAWKTHLFYWLLLRWSVGLPTVVKVCPVAPLPLSQNILSERLSIFQILKAGSFLLSSSFLNWPLSSHVLLQTARRTQAAFYPFLGILLSEISTFFSGKFYFPPHRQVLIIQINFISRLFFIHWLITCSSFHLSPHWKHSLMFIFSRIFC